jgi:hypothetical protein
MIFKNNARNLQTHDTINSFFFVNWRFQKMAKKSTYEELEQGVKKLEQADFELRRAEEVEKTI